MLHINQVNAMLALQDEMNTTVNPEWKSAGYPFLRAAVVEGAEAMEHHGWKWWKAQTQDLPQVQLELVDIFHFILSHLIIENEGDLDQAAKSVLEQIKESESFQFDGKSYQVSSLALLDKLELTVALSAVRRVSLPLFSGLLTDCQMDWDELYRQYVGKNTLNIFRQAKGYKEGTYIKEWQGREDNEHLVDLMDQLDPKDESFREQLTKGLESRYPA